MDFKVTWGFLECLAIVVISLLVSIGSSLGELLIAKLVERKRKRNDMEGD